MNRKRNACNIEKDEDNYLKVELLAKASTKRIEEKTIKTS